MCVTDDIGMTPRFMGFVTARHIIHGGYCTVVTRMCSYDDFMYSSYYTFSNVVIS